MHLKVPHDLLALRKSLASRAADVLVLDLSFRLLSGTAVGPSADIALLAFSDMEHANVFHEVGRRRVPDRLFVVGTSCVRIERAAFPETSVCAVDER